MSRRSRGRRRLQRRRQHMLVATAARPGLVAAAEAVIGEPLQPYQRAILEGIEERSRRNICPACGKSEKVKRDGTMGKHTAKIDGHRVDCPGIGRKPQ